jgi:methylated-DNA-[protein]-cysteine S-methyltransferase
MNYFRTSISSPVGPLLLVASETSLRYVLWGDEDRLLVPDSDLCENEVLKLAREELGYYFNGELKRFSVPIAFEGTEFQRQVWNALIRIPYGETWSYSKLAEEIGSPKAVRAVGLANRNNPISIIVPCHRVVGKNGSLTGFAGGLQSKALLLDLEWANRLA